MPKRLIHIIAVPYTTRTIGSFFISTWKSMCGIKHDYIRCRGQGETAIFGRYKYPNQNPLWFDETTRTRAEFTYYRDELVNCPVCLENPKLSLLLLKDTKL